MDLAILPPSSLHMYKNRFIITDNTIWVLNFSPSINYLGRGFNVFSKYEH